MRTDNDDFIDDIETLEEKVNESEGSFSIEFEDGHHFKNLVEYLKNTNSEGNFIITKQSFSYSRIGMEGKILNEVDFLSKEFTTYEFDSASDKIIIGVNLSDLRVVTTSIGKYDKLTIYKTSKEQKLYLKTDSNGTKKNANSAGNNISFILPKHVKFEKYLSEDVTTNNHPNHIVPSADFSKMCTAMGKSKCNCISVQGYLKGIKFEAITDDGIIGKSTIFGQLPTDGFARSKLVETNGINKIVLEDTNKYPKIKIDIEIIKKLAKLNNISKQNKLKLYVTENQFTLISQLGAGCGTLTVKIQPFNKNVIDDVGN